MNTRLLLIGTAVLILLSGSIWARLSYLKHKADKAQAVAVSATQQSNLATNTVHIIEKYHNTETIIREKAEDSAHAVEQIPSDDLPAGLRSAWSDGLRNVRSSAADNQPAR